MRWITAWSCRPESGCSGMWCTKFPKRAHSRALAVSAYALFQVPVWCGALNRDGRSYCRRNVSGILLGCSLRQHRWQKMKMIVLRSKVGKLSQAVFPTAKEKFAAFLAVGGLASAVAAVMVPLVVGEG